MLKDNITCLILSCDKFNDLWKGNLKLFRQNWENREFQVFLVTDLQTSITFTDVNIISAGINTEWSDRLKFALQYVKTDYVFITLDDYFLINKVDNERIKHLVNLMIQEKYDYIRLFKKPTKATSKKIETENDLYNINLNVNYSVNLYPGLWSKKFLEFCVNNSRSAWMFEVNLNEQALLYNARCLVSYKDEYKILDVVRKGKLLHNAAIYFKNNPGIYDGSRDLQSYNYEIKLYIKTFIQEHIPKPLFKIARSIYVKLGGQSFTYQKSKD
ncbi:hypothetical protein SDC9_105653 [bioreactor metagenome]|uniref:Glycosyltransferase 2-like domain-containing protein n=1 Tax=bioreactor metagenome TaxID=1076179 RepID=A0A645B062_9ZZZZ